MKIKIATLVMIVIATHAGAQLKPVTYSDGKQKLNGMFIAAAKTGNSNRSVLILPAWKGIDSHSKDTAMKLSALGYHAFIADIYGEGNYPKDTKEAGEKSGYYKKNFLDYQRRISLALEQLIKSGADGRNIAIMGYCFGGTGAIEAARAGLPVKGVVSLHGGLGKDASRPSNPMTAKILVCHGADEIFVPKEEVLAFQQEMRDTKADWQMIYYADAVHSFTDPDAGNDKSKGVAYNANADARSWQHTLLFFDEVLN